MGNLVGNRVSVIPSEEGVQTGQADSVGEKKTGADGVVVWRTEYNRPVLNSEIEGIYEPPSTIAEVLSNALYAMEFHKHLALT